MSIPQDADVVVIGAGIIGCSVFYHLSKAGVGSVILLEANKIASGTSWHSPALLPPLRSNGPGTELAKYSCQLYAKLENETGLSTGWRQPGHLNIASSKDRLIANKRGMSVAKSSDVKLELIGPDDVARMAPVLRTDDIHGAVWMPEAGRIDPNDACQSLVKGGRAHGGRVFEETPVTGFRIERREVKAVRTAEGEITCRTVVNCAGLWGRQVAEYAGVCAPLYACEHFYMLTDKIEGVASDMPLIRDANSYLYMREDVGGLLVGCFEPNPRAIAIDKLPRGPFILLNEDWDHFEPMLINGIHRVPAMENVGARALINGPESFTTDHNPLLGEVPEVKNFYMACAMNSSGVTMSGGIGWAMAEWVTKGRPPVDLWSHDVRRYQPFSNNTKALVERIPEVLARHHEITWPGSEYQTVRNIRRTPHYSDLKAGGAHFSQRGGWERPVFFSPDGAVAENHTFERPNWWKYWEAEHRAARENVAVFDQSPFAKLLIQGRDSEKFLQRICANNVDSPVGSVIYTPMLNVDGGLESDITVTRLSENSYFIVTGSQQGRRDAHWIESHIEPNEHVTLTDVTTGYSTLLVTGPKARDLMRRVSSADFSNESFPFRTARDIEIGYVVTRAARVSYAGELGWELYTTSDFAQHVLGSLKEAGKDLELRLAGSAALNSLRLEKGFRAWGHDIGPTDNPLESGLGFTVKMNKPKGFIGREAIQKLMEQAPDRQLVSVVFSDPKAFPIGHEPIYIDRKRCGTLGSASFGHTIGGGVALGWLDFPNGSEEGFPVGSYHVEVAGELYPVSLSVSAPYDPKGTRLRT